MKQHTRIQYTQYRFIFIQVNFDFIFFALFRLRFEICRDKFFNLHFNQRQFSIDQFYLKRNILN